MMSVFVGLYINMFPFSLSFTKTGCLHNVVVCYVLLSPFSPYTSQAKAGCLHNVFFFNYFVVRDLYYAVSVGSLFTYISQEMGANISLFFLLLLCSSVSFFPYMPSLLQDQTNTQLIQNKRNRQHTTNEETQTIYETR